MITGAGGFLGSHISRYLKTQNHKVYVTGRFSKTEPTWFKSMDGYYTVSLPDNTLNQILREVKPTILVHCAGSSSIASSLADPYNDYLNTVGLTASVLEAIRQDAPECKLIFPSSAAVYGNPSVIPISETVNCSPISPYGTHKMVSEKLIEEYFQRYGVSHTILRVFSAYGIGLRKQVIYDMCKKFTDPTTEYVEVYGTGTESRDFIHIFDICRAMDYVMKPNAQGIYNLGSGRQTTVSELVELIKKNYNNSKSIRFTGEVRLGDPINWEANIDKISKLGFRSTIPLEQGLKEYCEWYGKK
ncbi:NAD-dependent epimerase/dehydratase family protein [Cohnella terricola]|uniref:NAD-dependent epimerase/dehydratase family protein n=1 Tax=Cohnella terricola TaxID=1289167 RepID=UPI001649596A|nr:NAD(P)-dependent oxidoreductase [Cohnella terricola]